ncbi:hypothetical protein Y032_0076g1049 [Ancylostoma ceylanicum]|uniref:Uncharacterized protein n=1 Tax=Ancylostoma ceylanicum TaxID=53326 RepID=A0A016TVL5_9BILA|nr:hypothetical protein Y032_0076g1049 [Ancylostoma ceylanicum]
MNHATTLEDVISVSVQCPQSYEHPIRSRLALSGEQWLSLKGVLVLLVPVRQPRQEGALTYLRRRRCVDFLGGDATNLLEKSECRKLSNKT